MTFAPTTASLGWKMRFRYTFCFDFSFVRKISPFGPISRNCNSSSQCTTFAYLEWWSSSAQKQKSELVRMRASEQPCHRMWESVYIAGYYNVCSRNRSNRQVSCKKLQVDVLAKHQTLSCHESNARDQLQQCSIVPQYNTIEVLSSNHEQSGQQRKSTNFDFVASHQMMRSFLLQLRTVGRRRSFKLQWDGTYRPQSALVSERLKKNISERQSRLPLERKNQDSVGWLKYRMKFPRT